MEHFLRYLKTLETNMMVFSVSNYVKPVFNLYLWNDDLFRLFIQNNFFFTYYYLICLFLIYFRIIILILAYFFLCTLIWEIINQLSLDLECIMKWRLRECPFMWIFSNILYPCRVSPLNEFLNAFPSSVHKRMVSLGMYHKMLI